MHSSDSSRVREMIFLSHLLSQTTPTYGNRNVFVLEKKSDISKGDVANDSFMHTTVHIGTHLDLPYHFYNEGKTIEDFNADFWFFSNPLYIEITPKHTIVFEELIEALEKLDKPECDILLVKTGICHQREEECFWENNYGFHPDLYDYLIQKFPNLRVFGFDSISVSSFSERTIGREAHKRFLNPVRPILLLEDMNFCHVSHTNSFSNIIISPLRISKCDGVPCTVFGELND